MCVCVCVYFSPIDDQPLRTDMLNMLHILMIFVFETVHCLTGASDGNSSSGEDAQDF